ncbi:MAG: type VII secretion protein EssA [Bacillus sp. (in: firmicutes)]
MNHKWIIVCVISVGLIMGVKSASAAVEPNQYKEKEVKIDTDYFHDESLLERKESLPDELKDLTFSNEKQSASELAAGIVFHSTVNQQTVIATKAEQLQLFSADSAYEQSNDQSEKERSVGTIQFVLIVAVAVCVISIFFLATAKMNTNVRK